MCFDKLAATPSPARADAQDLCVQIQAGVNGV